MDWLTLHFSLDVPESEVQSPNGVGPFTARGIKEGAIHVLPETLDVLRIAADQPPGGLGQRILHATLTNARDSSIGLDGDHHVALVEKRVGMRRQVRTHPGNLHLGDRDRVGGYRARAARDCSGPQGFQKLSSLHDVRSPSNFETWSHRTRTADPSTPLRAQFIKYLAFPNRTDDNSSWEQYLAFPNRLVISTGA